MCTFIGAQKPFYYVQNHEIIPIDTISLENVEDYGQEDFVLNLGNHGSPEFSLKPELDDLIFNDYSVLTFQRKHQFRRYKVSKPIVDAKYVLGTGKEQHFSVLHAQNIKENVNYTVGLNKINSQGIYQNQSTNVTDVFFSSHGYGLLKKKYSYEIEFNYLNSAASLNGGLEDDSTFINDTLDLQNRELLDVNLLHAYQEKRTWYGQLEHSYEIVNTLDSNDKGYTIGLLSRFSFLQHSRQYYDSVLNTNYYDRILNDSSITNETATYQSTHGYLGLKYGLKRKSQLFFNAGVQAAYNTYNQLAVDTFRWDVEAKFKGIFILNSFLVESNISYLVNDPTTNKDYNADINIWYSAGKFDFDGRVYFGNERPQVDLLRYEGNHVSWNNSFTKYQIQHYKIKAKYNGVQHWDASLSLNYFDIHNPIYFGYDKTPYQVSGAAQLIRTSVAINNKNHHRWDLSGEVHYQYMGGYDVFRLPNILSKVSAAFKFKVFKKKMSAAVGADLIYFSKYSSKNFDPVTGQYYIYSNNDLGNYPYMNVFVKSRVQRATFFIMMSHPHQGLLGYDYFYFPGYPANDRFFRIGISWLFTN